MFILCWVTERYNSLEDVSGSVVGEDGDATALARGSLFMVVICVRRCGFCQLLVV